MAPRAPESAEFREYVERPELEVWSSAFNEKSRPSTTPLADFIWVADEEPHLSRRTAMLKKYPEIKKLMGPDYLTVPIMLTSVAAQIALSIYLSDKLFSLQFWLIVYFIGGTISHSLQLAIHEICHNLAHSSFKLNRWIGFIANFPMTLPMSITFRDYHLEHHRAQGVDGVDVDLPTNFEGWFFSNVFTKLFFCTFQIFFYTLRPLIIRPPKTDFYYFMNYFVQFSFDFLLWYFFGFGPLIYMATSVIVGGSLHPCAGHFLSEHYVFSPLQETFSYYGPLNIVSYNAGYHVEHHDFPNIPWSRISKVREIAPEFYENLFYHKSWSKVLWHFVTDSHISPRFRVKRREKFVNHFFKEQETRKEQETGKGQEAPQEAPKETRRAPRKTD